MSENTYNGITIVQPIYTKYKLKEIESFGWYCINSKESIWGLGYYIGEKLEDIVATCNRLKDGTWNWQTENMELRCFGNEPSKSECFRAISKVLEESLI